MADIPISIPPRSSLPVPDFLNSETSGESPPAANAPHPSEEEAREAARTATEAPSILTREAPAPSFAIDLSACSEAQTFFQGLEFRRDPQGHRFLAGAALNADTLATAFRHYQALYGSHDSGSGQRYSPAAAHVDKLRALADLIRGQITANPDLASRLEEYRLLAQVYSELSNRLGPGGARVILEEVLAAWLEELRQFPIEESRLIPGYSEIARLARHHGLEDFSRGPLSRAIQGQVDAWRNPSPPPSPRAQIQSRQLAYHLLCATADAMGEAMQNLRDDLMSHLDQDIAGLERGLANAEPTVQIQILGEIAAGYRMLIDHPEAGAHYRERYISTLERIQSIATSHRHRSSRASARLSISRSQIPIDLRLPILLQLPQEYESLGLTDRANEIRNQLSIDAGRALRQGRRSRLNVAERLEHLRTAYLIYRAIPSPLAGEGARRAGEGAETTARAIRSLLDSVLTRAAGHEDPELLRQSRAFALEGFLLIGELDRAESLLREIESSFSGGPSGPGDIDGGAESPTATGPSATGRQAQWLLRLAGYAQQIAAARSDGSETAPDFTPYREILRKLETLGHNSGQRTMELYARFLLATLDQDLQAEQIYRELQDYRPATPSPLEGEGGGEGSPLTLPNFLAPPQTYTPDPFQRMAAEIWERQRLLFTAQRSSQTLQRLSLLIEGHYNVALAQAREDGDSHETLLAQREEARRYLAQVSSIIASGQAASTREGIELLPQVMGQENAAREFYSVLGRIFGRRYLFGEVREVTNSQPILQLIELETIQNTDGRAQSALGVAEELLLWSAGHNNCFDPLIGSLLQEAQDSGVQGDEPRPVWEILTSLAPCLDPTSRRLEGATPTAAHWSEFYHRLRNDRTLQERVESTLAISPYLTAAAQTVQMVFSVEGGAIMLASIFTGGLAAGLAEGAMLARLGSTAYRVADGAVKMRTGVRLAMTAMRMGAASAARIPTELGGIAAYRAITGRRQMDYPELRQRVLTSLFSAVGDELAGALTRSTFGRAFHAAFGHSARGAARVHTATEFVEFFTEGLGEMYGEDMGNFVNGSPIDDSPFWVRYFQECFHGSFFTMGNQVGGELSGPLMEYLQGAAQPSGHLMGSPEEMIEPADRSPSPHFLAPPTPSNHHHGGKLLHHLLGQVRSFLPTNRASHGASRLTGLPRREISLPWPALATGALCFAGCADGPESLLAPAALMATAAIAGVFSWATRGPSSNTAFQTFMQDYRAFRARFAEGDFNFLVSPEYPAFLRRLTDLLRPPPGMNPISLAEIDALEATIDPGNPIAPYGLEPRGKRTGVYQAISGEQVEALAQFITCLGAQSVVEVGAGDGRLAAALSERLANSGIAIRATDDVSWNVAADPQVEGVDAVDAARNADVVIASWPPKHGGRAGQEAFDLAIARMAAEHPEKTFILLMAENDTGSPEFRGEILETGIGVEEVADVPVRVFEPLSLNYVRGEDGALYSLGRSRRKVGVFQTEGSYTLVLRSQNAAALPGIPPLSVPTPPEHYRVDRPTAHHRVAEISGEGPDQGGGDSTPDQGGDTQGFMTAPEDFEERGHPPEQKFLHDTLAQFTLEASQYLLAEILHDAPPPIRAALREYEEYFEIGAHIVEEIRRRGNPSEIIYRTEPGGKVVSSEVHQAFQTWQLHRGFPAAAEGDPTAVPRLVDFLDDFDIEVELPGGPDPLSAEQARYIHGLLQILPESFFQNTPLRRLVLGAPFGGGRFAGDTLQIDLHGSRRNLLGTLLHELGHGTGQRYGWVERGEAPRPPERGIPVEIRDQLAADFQTLTPENYFIVDWADGREARRRYIQELPEFIAEFHLHYVACGDQLRAHIAGIQDPAQREAYQRIYREIRDRIFTGREYHDRGKIVETNLGPTKNIREDGPEVFPLSLDRYAIRPYIPRHLSPGHISFSPSDRTEGLAGMVEGYGFLIFRNIKGKIRGGGLDYCFRITLVDPTSGIAVDSHLPIEFADLTIFVRDLGRFVNRLRELGMNFPLAKVQVVHGTMDDNPRIQILWALIPKILRETGFTVDRVIPAVNSSQDFDFDPETGENVPVPGTELRTISPSLDPGPKGGGTGGALTALLAVGAGAVAFLTDNSARAATEVGEVVGDGLLPWVVSAGAIVGTGALAVAVEWGPMEPEVFSRHQEVLQRLRELRQALVTTPDLYRYHELLFQCAQALSELRDELGRPPPEGWEEAWDAMILEETHQWLDYLRDLRLERLAGEGPGPLEARNEAIKDVFATVFRLLAQLQNPGASEWAATIQKTTQWIRENQSLLRANPTVKSYVIGQLLDLRDAIRPDQPLALATDGQLQLLETTWLQEHSSSLIGLGAWGAFTGFHLAMGFSPWHAVLAGAVSGRVAMLVHRAMTHGVRQTLHDVYVRPIESLLGVRRSIRRRRTALPARLESLSESPQDSASENETSLPPPPQSVRVENPADVQFEVALQEEPEEVAGGNKGNGRNPGSALTALLAIGAGAAALVASDVAYATVDHAGQDAGAVADTLFQGGWLAVAGVFGWANKKIQGWWGEKDESSPPGPVLPAPTGEGPYRTLPDNAPAVAASWQAPIREGDQVIHPAEVFAAIFKGDTRNSPTLWKDFFLILLQRENIPTELIQRAIVLGIENDPQGNHQDFFLALRTYVSGLPDDIALTVFSALKKGLRKTNGINFIQRISSLTRLLQSMPGLVNPELIAHLSSLLDRDGEEGVNDHLYCLHVVFNLRPDAFNGLIVNALKIAYKNWYIDRYGRAILESAEKLFFKIFIHRPDLVDETFLRRLGFSPERIRFLQTRDSDAERSYIPDSPARLIDLTDPQNPILRSLVDGGPVDFSPLPAGHRVGAETSALLREKAVPLREANGNVLGYLFNRSLRGFEGMGYRREPHQYEYAAYIRPPARGRPQGKRLLYLDSFHSPKIGPFEIDFADAERLGLELDDNSGIKNQVFLVSEVHLVPEEEKPKGGSPAGGALAALLAGGSILLGAPEARAQDILQGISPMSSLDPEMIQWALTGGLISAGAFLAGLGIRRLHERWRRWRQNEKVLRDLPRVGGPYRETLPREAEETSASAATDLPAAPMAMENSQTQGAVNLPGAMNEPKAGVHDVSDLLATGIFHAEPVTGKLIALPEIPEELPAASETQFFRPLPEGSRMGPESSRRIREAGVAVRDISETPVAYLLLPSETRGFREILYQHDYELKITHFLDHQNQMVCLVMLTPSNADAHPLLAGYAIPFDQMRRLGVPDPIKGLSFPVSLVPEAYLHPAGAAPITPVLANPVRRVRVEDAAEAESAEEEAEVVEAEVSDGSTSSRQNRGGNPDGGAFAALLAAGAGAAVLVASDVAHAAVDTGAAHADSVAETLVQGGWMAVTGLAVAGVFSWASRRIRSWLVKSQDEFQPPQDLPKPPGLGPYRDLPGNMPQETPALQEPIQIFEDNPLNPAEILREIFNPYSATSKQVWQHFFLLLDPQFNLRQNMRQDDLEKALLILIHKNLEGRSDFWKQFRRLAVSSPEFITPAIVSALAQYLHKKSQPELMESLDCLTSILRDPSKWSDPLAHQLRDLLGIGSPDLFLEVLPYLRTIIMSMPGQYYRGALFEHTMANLYKRWARIPMAGDIDCIYDYWILPAENLIKKFKDFWEIERPNPLLQEKSRKEVVRQLKKLFFEIHLHRPDLVSPTMFSTLGISKEEIRSARRVRVEVAEPQSEDVKASEETVEVEVGEIRRVHPDGGAIAALLAAGAGAATLLAADSAQAQGISEGMSGGPGTILSGILSGILIGGAVLVGGTVLTRAIDWLREQFRGHGPDPSMRYSENEGIVRFPENPVAPPHQPGQPLTAVTYNMGYGSGAKNNTNEHLGQWEMEDNLRNMVPALRPLNPDILCLQEVDFTAARTFDTDQMEYLARGLGMGFAAFAVTWRGRYIPFPYWPPQAHFGRMLSGQAVLSRFPIQTLVTTTFPKPPLNAPWYNYFYLDHIAQQVWLNMGASTLEVWNVHLEAFDAQHRLVQNVDLAKLVDASSHPHQIVAGDFNSDRDESFGEFLRITRHVEAQDPQAEGTFPIGEAGGPYLTLDHITHTPEGIEILETGTLSELTASDHAPRWARMRLRGAGEGFPPKDPGGFAGNGFAALLAAGAGAVTLFAAEAAHAAAEVAQSSGPSLTNWATGLAGFLLLGSLLGGRRRAQKNQQLPLSAQEVPTPHPGRDFLLRVQAEGLPHEHQVALGLLAEGRPRGLIDLSASCRTALGTGKIRRALKEMELAGLVQGHPETGYQITPRGRRIHRLFRGFDLNILMPPMGLDLLRHLASGRWNLENHILEDLARRGNAADISQSLQILFERGFLERRRNPTYYNRWDYRLGPLGREWVEKDRERREAIEGMLEGF